jgi:transposase
MGSLSPHWASDCALQAGCEELVVVGRELAGQRAAAVIRLVQPAKLNRIKPWNYLRDLLSRIYRHPANRIDELLPHRWHSR